MVVMPRNRRNYSNCLDVTLQDFADAEKTGNLRKKFQIKLKPQEEPRVYEVLDDEDVTEATQTLAKANKSPNELEVNADHSYNYFPDDIWFLISEYICPEDITRFALICKQTHDITATLKFWRNVFNRYYDTNVDLPVRLQKDCMARPRGLRACAIRSLFYTYSPFVARLPTQSQQDFHSLVKRRIIQFWYEQTGGNYMYFFKLKRKLQPGTLTFASNQIQRKNGKSIQALSDIYCNSEEGCSLIVIESTKFHPLPRLEMIESNVVLSSITNHLSRSCNHFRLEMHFANVSGVKIGSVVYEPANQIRVYDWWVPIYSKYVKHGNQPSLEYVKDDKDTEIDNNLDGTDDDAWDYVINNF